MKKYNRYLRDMIISGKADPSFVVSHEIDINEAPEAYEKFDKRIDGYTKVLIHPNGPLNDSVASKGVAENEKGHDGERDVLIHD